MCDPVGSKVLSCGQIFQHCASKVSCLFASSLLQPRDTACEARQCAAWIRSWLVTYCAVPRVSENRVSSIALYGRFDLALIYITMLLRYVTLSYGLSQSFNALEVNRVPTAPEVNRVPTALEVNRVPQAAGDHTQVTPRPLYYTICLSPLQCLLS